MPDFAAPWVIARVGECLIGVESGWASEMIVLPNVAAVPLSPSWVRGVATRRGSAFTVLDLRLLLGLRTLAAENAALLAVLAEREQDHRRWLAELEASVAESRAFTLATDPTKCAFGRWYAAYRAPNDVLARHLKSFDQPHRAVHAVALQVEALLQRGQREEATALVERTRGNQLARLLALFHGTATVLDESTRETVIIHDDGGDAVGLTVDRIEAVARLDAETFQTIPVIGCEAAALISGTARAPGSTDIVLLLDTAAVHADTTLSA